MKPVHSAILLAAVSAAALPAHATIERTVEKSFTVSGAGALHIETGGGGIKVTPGADGVVKITAREKIDADSDAQADSLLKDLDLTFDQSGNDVSAIAKYERSFSAFHFGHTPVHVSFVAEVPAAFAASLRTSGGSVTVGDLNGDVNIRTSGGGIKLGKVGGKVDARTSGGGIRLAESRNEVTLHTSGGSVDVGRVGGPADISTSGGSISIDAVEQKVNAHTSGGPIRVGIVGPLKDDCVLATSGGGIHVTVDKSAAFNLDASTSGGSVRADGLTITLSAQNQSRTRLAGAVNGGGPELMLRTSGGGITIQVR